MEEKFLHAWDELDDTLCLCRQLATLAVSGAWDNSMSILAGAAGVLLAGTATLLLGVRQFFDPSA
jgi:hypothetical protein